jgi:DNA-binding response OmpR family regulator
MADLNKKILIVDDDPYIGEMYTMQFCTDGFLVDTAVNAKMAEAKISKDYIPDVILLDIIMPGDNGIQLLERLEKNPLLASTKIIIFSNLDQRADIDANILNKITGYYLKVDMIPSDMSKKLKEILGV